MTIPENAVLDSAMTHLPRESATSHASKSTTLLQGHAAATSAHKAAPIDLTYLGLIFREEASLGRVFRIVMKDADHEEEVLYPVSALTPPPPRGCSDLPPRWASELPELRLAVSAANIVPELVSSGALTPRQGTAVAGMIAAEDPVIFAACRVAGATAAVAAGPALEMCDAADPAGNERVARGVGQEDWVRGEALRSLTSMLEIVLADRAKGRVGRQPPGGTNLRPDTSVAAPENFVAGEAVDWAVRGFSNRNPELSSKEPLRGHGGYDGYGSDGGGERGGGGGGGEKGYALAVVPERFQADAIALADVALATGKITKATYIRALHRAVTLDPGLVRAYHADVDRHRRRDEDRGLPHATLRAFGAIGTEPPPAPVAVEFFEEGRSSPKAHLLAPSSASASVAPRGRAGLTGAGGRRGDGGGDGGRVASDEGTMIGGLRAIETELRDGLLRQALSSIVEGTVTGGLSARHRAIVEHAIATEHPWVLAIYEECKETGDVRGLVLNLQRLPALLERDQATAFAADVSQPPPPGELDPPFWPRQLRQPQIHERRRVLQCHGIQPPPPPLPPPPPPPPAGSGSAVRRWSNARKLATAPTTAQETTPGEDGFNDWSKGSEGGPTVPIDTGGTKGADGGIEPAASANVVAQLGRVIAGCSKLLRLRGAIGEKETKALGVMSRRGSPVLLVAVEAYGANQDIEGLLDTLQTAAEAELLLDAEKDAGGQKAPARPLQTLDRQLLQKQQQRQQQRQQQQQYQQQQAHDPGYARVSEVDSGSDHLGNWDYDRAIDTAAAAVTVKTALSPVGQVSAADDRKYGMKASGANVAMSSMPCPTITRIRIRSSRAANPSEGGGDSYCCPPNVVADVARDHGNETRARSRGWGSASPASPDLDTPQGSAIRRSASGARAQELMSAKFASMRSAAEARARACADAAAVTEASSKHQGVFPCGAGDDRETSGDKGLDTRLRQDLSRLIAVMDKSGMLTDRQRVFLLAQVGQRITEPAREKHARYRETGDSRELYAVLMALCAPTSRDDGEEGEEDEETRVFVSTQEGEPEGESGGSPTPLVFGGVVRGDTELRSPVGARGALQAVFVDGEEEKGHPGAKVGLRK